MKALEITKKGKYGAGVDMMLFQLYIEGEHNWFNMPSKNTLTPFSKKTKSWRFNIPLSLSQQKKIHSFHDMSMFIVQTMQDLRNILKAREKNMPENFYLGGFLLDLLSLEKILKNSGLIIKKVK